MTGFLRNGKFLGPKTQKYKSITKLSVDFYRNLFDDRHWKRRKFQGKYDYTQRTPLWAFWGKNWFASYFLFHCFAFPNSFLFRTGDPLLLRSCSGTWVTSILRLGEFFTQFFQLILSFPPAASWIRTQFETPDVMEQTPEEKRRLLARLIRSTQYVNLFWDKTVFFMETRLLNVGMLHFENLIFIVKLIMLLPKRL